MIDKSYNIILILFIGVLIIFLTHKNPKILFKA
jgi:hypothetical protein